MLNIKRLFKKNGLQKKEYEQSVNDLIRKRYTLSEELSILRRKDACPEQFSEYNDFVEDCKKEAKIEVYGEVENNE